MDIKDKNVVITGASSGIGYDLMIKLLNSGCKVIAASRTISKIEFNHENLWKYDCDVSSVEGVDKLFDYAYANLKSIDIFIANAGFAFYEKLVTPDWSHLMKIFNTNVFSAIYAAEKLKITTEGRPYNFVITASAMGFVSLPGYALYSSTKAALRGFADSYRYELLKGQTLQVVFPIAVKTEFFKNAGDIPSSWPIQTSSFVADCIIRGIRRNKLDIYPSKIFLMFKLMSALCPPVVKLYNKMPYKNFIKWLNTHNKK